MAAPHAAPVQHTLALAGNRPERVLAVSLRHKLELKACTLLAGLASALVLLHQLQLNTAFFEAAEAAGHPVTAANTTAVPLGQDVYSVEGRGFGDSPLWWWVHSWGAGSVTLSSCVVTLLPLWFLAGRTLVRWRAAALAAAAVLALNCAVVFGISAAQLRGAHLSAAVVDGIAFGSQLLPALALPVLLSAALSAAASGAVRMHATAVTVQLVVAGTLAAFVAPAFARASPGAQVAIRLLGLPLAVEALVMVTRCVTRRFLRPWVPQDAAQLYLSHAILNTAIVGRFLTTSMASTELTVAVSLATAAIEVAMRLSMVHRDAAYAAVCSACDVDGRRRRAARVRGGAAEVRLVGGGADGGGGKGGTAPAPPVTLHSRSRSSGSRGGRFGSGARLSPAPGALVPTPRRAGSSSGSGFGTGDAAGPGPGGLSLGLTLPSSDPGREPRSVSVSMALTASPAAGAAGGRGAVRPGGRAPGLPTGAALAAAAAGAPVLQARRGVGQGGTGPGGVHAYYAYLLGDTMAEDIGILASLPLALLFRLPARPGGAPIPPDAVVLRVALQYALEALTDVGPALAAWTLARACGVRLSPAVHAAVAAATANAAAQHGQGHKVTAQPPTGHGQGHGSPGSAAGSAASLDGAAYAVQEGGVIDDSATAAEARQVAQRGGDALQPQGSCAPCTGDGRGVRWSCVLYSRDQDVVAARRAATEAHLARSAAIARDPVWAPVDMRALLQLALFGAPAPAPAAAATGGGTSSPAPASPSTGTRTPPGPHTYVHPGPGPGSSPGPGGSTARPGTGQQLTPVLSGRASPFRGSPTPSPGAHRRSGSGSGSPFPSPPRGGSPGLGLGAASAFGASGSASGSPLRGPVAAPSLLAASLGRPGSCSSFGSGARSAFTLVQRSDTGASGGSRRGALAPLPQKPVPPPPVPPGAVLGTPLPVGGRLEDLSPLQYALGWLALRSEVIAVRLTRAWESRQPGWALLWVLGTLHALTITARLLAGAGLRCPLQDGEGGWRWDYCAPL